MNYSGTLVYECIHVIRCKIHGTRVKNVSFNIELKTKVRLRCGFFFYYLEILTDERTLATLEENDARPLRVRFIRFFPQ